MATYNTPDEALQALETALAEVAEDQPDICLDSAWYELAKYTIAPECSPIARAAILRHIGATPT